eukprot:CAMPEP_0117028594 /NCGR_PEP_ID=MMETSP0472-20121206/20780_1 /TAXON_ID=693140 ORGANISM="Tiarina fusus, Strain LIS" /NCGR_SAMPLE_ID=MMETSP0472 /ASSEMBLY_ACC=CAM_ASM_000603 /LENGTH=282 /DNA_ID=CAMNT_0004736131 /DNA_START=16 /DNA_END=861 /DNA_ORIENTATION=-
MTEPEEGDEVGKQLRNLANILDNPEERILPLFYGSTEEANEQRKQARRELVVIAKSLFGEIENVAKQYHEVTNKLKLKSGEQATSSEVLSGLDELYAPSDDAIDAEMLWGQVELQNQAALKLAKKSIKKLQKNREKVVVLDMSQISSGEDESGSENDDDSAEGGGKLDEEMHAGKDSASDEDEEENSDGDEDEETRRIRARMKRAMADEMDSDMDDDDEQDDDIEEDGVDSKPEATRTEETLYDPVAEEMKDGFFDLNEMEDFADEEEDFLPEEAYGTTEDS